MMKDFPVPAEPVKKKNLCCLFVLDPIRFVSMFMILYCSVGRVMVMLSSEGDGSI